MKRGRKVGQVMIRQRKQVTLQVPQDHAAAIEAMATTENVSSSVVYRRAIAAFLLLAKSPKGFIIPTGTNTESEVMPVCSPTKPEDNQGEPSAQG